MTEFEELAAVFGGVVSDVPHGQLHHWKRVRQRMLNAARRRGQPVDFQVGYIQDPTFNAWATTRNGVDIIAINIGVEWVLLPLMVGLLSHPCVAPHVGDPATCNRFVAPSRVGTTDFLSVFPPPSVDPHRSGLAVSLRNLAELFVIEHEHAHIVNGHTDWLQQRHGIAVLDELRMASIEGLSNIDRQTLEWDADSHAIGRLLMAVLQVTVKERTKGPNEWLIPNDIKFGSVKAALEHLGFVIYVCYRIFSGPIKKPDLKSVLASTHPPAAIRMQFNTFFLSYSLRVRTKTFDPEWEGAALRGARQAEQAWSQMFSEPELDVFDEKSIELGRQLLGLFNDRWRTMHGELDPLKRGGKLAPPEPYDDP